MEIEDKIRIGSITLIVMFIITVLLCFIPSDTVVLHESVRHNTKGRTVTIQVVQEYNVFGGLICTTNKIKK